MFGFLLSAAAINDRRLHVSIGNTIQPTPDNDKLQALQFPRKLAKQNKKRKKGKIILV
jgi:hypothetical protein